MSTEEAAVMNDNSNEIPSASTNWLGFPSPFPQPSCHAYIPRGNGTASLGVLLNHGGDVTAAEDTDVQLWYDGTALHLRARCETAAMARVRDLAARQVPYARDAWGDDAIEVQIDVGRTRSQCRHFILPPNERAITFTSYNNRTEHGWHPDFNYRVSLEADAWTVEASFSFSILGRTPAAGEVWGLNVMRVNPSEPTRYVQWAPTFGDALRPELFGEIQFSGGLQKQQSRAAECAAYARRAATRKACFLDTINGLSEADVLPVLGFSDWDAWGRHLAGRGAPLPLRWEGICPGVEGIPPSDREFVLETADALAANIATWPLDPPPHAAFALEQAECLADAFLLTEDRKYVAAFEDAMKVHARLLRLIQADVKDPRQLPYSRNPYYDYMVVRAGMMAYCYLTMRRAGLSAETHAAMMWTVLRSGRFAAFNISDQYNFGNHQIYESGALSTLAALFPEIPESDDWAAVAGRSIHLHLEREVYPDGAYWERCGYHEVAVTFTMQAITTIHHNRLEGRFPELMAPGLQKTFERMYEWILLMTAPDGSLPAFGDYGSYSMVTFLRRGAAVFGRPDLLWPVEQVAPAMIPPGIRPRLPETSGSVSLPSQFTVLRDGWGRKAFYMALDHGPLGSQHSHVDTLGFVAHAHGRAIALDSGIGANYEDPRYLTWFRSLRAHNVVAIGEFETEKVAERTLWRPGPHADVVGMRSHAYEHALGVIHERTVVFVKQVGWFIRDRLSGPATLDFAAHPVDWLLHTPYELVAEGSGVLHGAAENGGLLLLAGRADELEAPRLELRPAAMAPPEAVAMRHWDSRRDARYAGRHTLDITCATWRRRPLHGCECEFINILLPYEGPRPDARLVAAADNSWHLHLNSEHRIEFTHDNAVTCVKGGKILWRDPVAAY